LPAHSRSAVSNRFWAPEHSHIPLSRKTPFPGGGDLPKQYYDAMDPFVVLAAASQVTKTIKLGTGVLLVEHHPDLIFDVCHHVTVLNLGKMLAAGRPAEIRSHREVVNAYLGG